MKKGAVVFGAGTVLCLSSSRRSHSAVSFKVFLTLPPLINVGLNVAIVPAMAFVGFHCAD
jgi:hypothetical protein